MRDVAGEDEQIRLEVEHGQRREQHVVHGLRRKDGVVRHAAPVDAGIVEDAHALADKPAFRPRGARAIRHAHGAFAHAVLILGGHVESLSALLGLAGHFAHSQFDVERFIALGLEEFELHAYRRQIETNLVDNREIGCQRFNGHGVLPLMVHKLYANYAGFASDAGLRMIIPCWENALFGVSSSRFGFAFLITQSR